MATLSQLTLGVFGDDPYAALLTELTPSSHLHARAQIRDWVVGRLQSGALLPAKIKAQRGIPTAMDDLPSVFVYTLQENDAEEFDQSPRVIARQLRLVVLALVSQAALGGLSIDDVVDAFMYAIEVLLLNDRGPRGTFFGGLAQRCDLGGTSIELESDGARYVVAASVTFAITYQQEIAVPVENMVRSIWVDWDKAPQDGRIDARDRVLLPVVGAMAGRIVLRGDFTGTFGV